MNIDKLLVMTPETLARSIVERRHELNAVLPEIVRERKSELDAVEPLVEEELSARNKATAEVAELKKKRDALQGEARKLRTHLTKLRETLIAEGRLKNPNPAWAQEKLANRITDVEAKIQTSAHSLNQERKLLREMKELTRKHEEWVANRLDKDPELKEYREGWARHRELLDEADKHHGNLIQLAGESENQDQKYQDHKEVRRLVKSQYNKARALLDSYDDIVKYWDHRIENGFDDLKDGTGDLLAAARRVANGEPSSMAQKKEEKSTKSNKKEVKE